jgi:hypothetical protein
MSDEKSKKQFHVWAYRAVDEPELCKEYIRGHIKVLTDYGITNITSNNNTWVENQYIYCVVVEDSDTKELVGGIRIQIADGVFPLPVENAIGKLDAEIYKKVKYYALNGGVGELSGLWVSNKLKGVGMSVYLVRASVASASQLNFQTMTGICAGYSLKMFKDVGFYIDDSLGNKGNFPYPNDEYIANVVGILNVKTLETANEFDKLKMFDLRNKPIQERTEINGNISADIFYNIIYPNIIEMNYKH